MTAATIAAPAQPALFELDELTTAVPVYDEAASRADRELCQRYFRAWCGSFGSLDGSPAGHPSITREEFEAAAERLASDAASEGANRP